LGNKLSEQTIAQHSYLLLAGFLVGLLFDSEEEEEGSTFLRNVGEILPDHTESHLIDHNKFYINHHFSQIITHSFLIRLMNRKLCPCDRRRPQETTQ
jgi:hypothetical protein